VCGIIGVYNLNGGKLPEFDRRRALESLRHRGPDDKAEFEDEHLYLGATRLAIIDPASGRQPVADETGRFHLAMNGEIFDYDLLLRELRERGHVFRSRCDTEVAVHLFEELWTDALDRIDGQFAIAAYDAREQRLCLARDRMGISPLFYTRVGDCLAFASEMKALFASGLVEPTIDPRSLDAVLAFGCVPAPRTMFKGVRSLPPGSYLEVRKGKLREQIYWDIPYPDAGEYPSKSEAQWREEFREVFQAACRRRLKADVPVGIYLSGGIDSSAVAAMVRDNGGMRGRAFSIGFPEPGFDESRQSGQVARHLDLEPHMLLYRQRDLVRDLPRLIYHGECPLVSTESVPLMALSGRAAKQVKVVLTGEGADEALGGYEYFRWEVYRESRQGMLVGRPLLLLAKWAFGRALGWDNPLVPTARTVSWAQEVFGFYPAEMFDFFYFRGTRERVYSREMLARQRTLSDAELVDLPRERMLRWDQLNRSLYVSSRVFMTTHLLGSHGDRALMANSVEGRYPFLDRSVQEFLATVPPGLKIRPGVAKLLLRQAMKGTLPLRTVWRRKKQFLAPFGTPFVGDDCSDYVRELLSPQMLRRFGYFDHDKVARIVREIESLKQSLGRDRRESVRLDPAVKQRTVLGLALTFVVSMQILADLVARGAFRDGFSQT